MLKLIALSFTILAGLSFGATTAEAGPFNGNRTAQPTSVSVPMCQYGSDQGHCNGGPQFGFGHTGTVPCVGHHHVNCTPDGSTIPDCEGGNQTIYGTTHECL